MRPHLHLAGAALLVLACSCISGSYQIQRIETQPSSGAFDSLALGEADLTQCLDTLGAPLIVSVNSGNSRDGSTSAMYVRSDSRSRSLALVSTI